jgi:hypothetical protein
LSKMRKEMELFENFTTLTKAPQTEVKYTKDLIQVLKPDNSSEHILPSQLTDPPPSKVELCKRYRDSSFHKPLSDNDIDLLDSIKDPERETKAQELLEKIGRIQILDITEEIIQLREIKDIQDELNIMSMSFEDQKKVLSIMDEIITSMPAIQSSSQLLLQRKEHSKQSKAEDNLPPSKLKIKATDVVEQSARLAKEESSMPVEMNLTGVDEPGMQIRDIRNSQKLT